MESITEWVHFLTATKWAYVFIFLLAIAEASVLTSYFVSGTIAFVIIGVLAAKGMLDPVWSVLAVYVGTLVGDVATFLACRAFQRVKFIAAALEKFQALREPLKQAPARFILVGHFTPYLRSMLPLLAADIVPLRTYLAIECIGAMAGTVFFVGLGYAGAQILADIELNNALTAVGVVAGGMLVAMWIYSRKPFCRLKPDRRIKRKNLWRAVWFYLWFVPFQLARWIELWLGRSPSRRLRRSLAASFPDIRPGDVFVIRLHVPSPWGRWAHSAIAIDSRNFCHGFASVVTAHTISALPVRYAIAHLRVRCDEPTAEAAAEIARACVGFPVSIAACPEETGRFSCSSLIAHAYRQVGIELVDRAVSRIVPDDLFTSPHLELVRIVHTEQVRQQTGRYVFEARKEGYANDQ